MPDGFCSLAGNAVFHWFYKVFVFTVSWNWEPRGGSSPRPEYSRGNQRKPWFYQGFPMVRHGFPCMEAGRLDPPAGGAGLQSSWKCSFSIGFIRFSRAPCPHSDPSPRAPLCYLHFLLCFTMVFSVSAVRPNQLPERMRFAVYLMVIPSPRALICKI